MTPSATHSFAEERRAAIMAMLDRSASVQVAELARATADAQAGTTTTTVSGAEGREVRRFEGTVEQAYTQNLWGECQRERSRQQRRKEQEIGFMGLGTDWEKVRAIERETIASCEVLRQMGVLR